MGSLALGIGIPLLLVLAIVVVVVRRGLQMRQLVEDGIETRGRVVERFSHTSRTYQSQKRLKYEYRDRHGELHEHVSLVSDSFWNVHPRGMPIAVVYVRRRPEISAPLDLVKQAREATKADQG
jgi:hypothetical protein